MKITITQSAKDSLFDIYVYHLDYSEKFADAFQFKIDEFIVSNLSEFPKLGHVYNPIKMLYRLIFEGRYNIYYQIEDDELYVLYVLDGNIDLNTQLLSEDVNLPNKF